jgi:hypothetical protein
MVEDIPALLRDHVTLTVESVDRVYLNGYVPKLQHPAGVYHWLKEDRGLPIPSPAMLGKIGDAFVRAVERFAAEHGLVIQKFPKAVRKEEYVRPYFTAAASEGRTGVVFIGKAQEKARSFRGVLTAEGKAAGQPWYHFQPCEVFVTWFYFYILDPEFGPCFIKMCTYAPFTIRVYVNAHEWAKRQLTEAGVTFTELDNGFAGCSDPAAVQAVCDRFGPQHIHLLVRRWMDVLPQPLSPEDRLAGYTHQLSILQAEFSHTAVFAQPRYGRAFFEQAIRDHLDLGRPDQVSLLFERRVTKRTPGVFRTRVITAGVNPNIQATFKHSAVKQYFKEGRALRTETTINDTYDIGVGRALANLPKLIEFGRALNRRLLEAEQTSARCLQDIARLDHVLNPSVVDGQRVPALRFGDPRTFALEAALSRFAVGPLAPLGFRAADLRAVLPDLRGGLPYSAAQATYDLRRLRLKGIIERVPRTHRYRLTPWGARTALVLVKLQDRVLRPALSLDNLLPHLGPTVTRALASIDRLLGALTVAAQP